MSSPENLVIVQEVYKIYKDGDVETVALKNANLTVRAGDFVAITGRSGGGKSTLLNLLGGLALPSAGRIMVQGVDLVRATERQRSVFRRAHIGIVFQANNLIPFLTAAENVTLPMTLAHARNTRSRAGALLRQVGLEDRLNHRPNQLSGGERQRVAIAVALANEPQLLLADELTGELDSVTADSIMALLNMLNAEHGLTLIVVTHNPLVARHGTRQVSLQDGVLIDERAVTYAG